MLNRYQGAKFAAKLQYPMTPNYGNGTITSNSSIKSPVANLELSYAFHDVKDP